MSLINQMLQDLDSRRAANGPKSGLPNEVRPLPAARRSNAPLLLGVGVVVSLLAGWFVWQLADLRAAQERREEVVLASAAVPPAPSIVAPGLPTAPVVSPPLALTDPEVLPAVPPGVSVEDEEARLRLTTSLKFLPERAPVAAPLAPPARPVSPVLSVTASAAPAVAASPTPPPIRGSGAMVLEKSAPSSASGSAHERAEADYRKAIASLNAGRLPEATESLRTALKLEAVHTAARQLLFRLLVENNHLDDAGEVLQEGLVLQPAQLPWAMSLGRLQVDRGDLPGAWKTLQRSLPFAANSADFQGFAAHVLQRLGRSKDAAEHYQAATRLAPAEGRWWLGLGLALDADGHVAEAREALLRAKASGTLNAELVALVDQRLR